MNMVDRILELKKRKNVLILAHNYQLPEIQEIADFVGDSLMLSQKASEAREDIILFCGVHFMAETASILCPYKKVLIPDKDAGCSLADSLTYEELKAWKKRYPDAVVVTYINSTAKVKSISDYCVTSSNAVKIVNSIPEDKMILFGPDMFLGSYVARVTKRRNMRIWCGDCHVHSAIKFDDLKKAKEEHKNAKVLLHPECACVNSCLNLMEKGEEIKILSTEGMVKFVEKDDGREYIVVTEKGILHRLNKISKEKKFYLLSEKLECEYMKMITLEKVLKSLEDEIYEVKVDEEVRSRAYLPIERMLKLS